MPFTDTNTYTIQDKENSSAIQIKSIKRVENWYKCKIENLSLSEQLSNLFTEVEEKIKKREFALVNQIETQILSHALTVKETQHRINEIQMGKKQDLYFKIEEL